VARQKRGMAAHTHAVAEPGKPNPSGNHEALLVPKALDRKPNRDRNRTRTQTTNHSWSGFRHLGFRLSAVIPETEIVEVDHPATQGAKLRALEKNSIRIPSNLKFLGLDLSRQSFPPEFAKGSDSTLFVIEGLLMYLEPEIVNRLFESLRKLPAQHVRVLFSFMTEWPGGGIGFQPSSWLINQWLDWHKEPFSWGLKPQAMNDFLVSHGFVMRELFSSHKLAEEYGLGSVDLEGENMVSCETG
jgi:O-methyltransferase involved in polyketide biosynthesis